MNWNLVTLADSNYKEKQDYLTSYAENLGLSNLAYSFDWLKQTSFYQENKEILDEKTGCGYWLWKPYIILDAMNKLDDGQMIIYSDVGDIFHQNLFPYVENIMDEDDSCLLLIGGFPNKCLTKRDCFVFMDCDEEDYWDCIQLEAGMSFWKVCDKSKQIVSEWLEYCKDRRIISDDENVSGKENLSGFRGHFHDQSILTNLAVKHGLPAVTQQDQIRNYLECNVDYWYERFSESNYNRNRDIERLLIEMKEGSPYA